MNLPSYLFWDTDINSIDYDKNARFVIQRVIQRGSLENWIDIKNHYGLDFIKKEMLMMRDLDPKTLNFFSIYFGVEKKYFRCYSIQQSTQQSTQKYFNY